MTRRSFLILQGTASPFFRRLGAALQARGHAVQRVNFCGGDLLYAGDTPSWNYTGTPEALPAWYRDVLSEGGFSDVILFGDCREIHRHVHPLCRTHGVTANVFEEGYVRPFWLTLERVGVNARSTLPCDPSWYLDRRASTPRVAAAAPTGYNVAERALHDIRYRAANTAFKWRFPHYRTHRPRNGFAEYAGLASRVLAQRRFDSEARAVTAELRTCADGYYFFPLQLDADSQIVVHSPFDGVHETIRKVLTSFADNAPARSLIALKNHPLDTGLTDHRQFTMNLARTLGIAERVRFIDGGHLPTLLGHARGVVVVNSTVGMSALHHRRPLIALGTAVYSMPGLTWQGDLDAFWLHGEAPDVTLYEAFLDYVVHHTQINGDFYIKTGIAMATAGAVERLEAREHG
ncbi:WcbO [Caballeronia novacaledonica]|uniref:WcbO n=1 Tax=Caballeronia novacaledonica TaxID=1544861 RepID=A0A2U3I654_9BURK|nr:capsular biosynthesis protein [Caballeronia novacaledonica]SPB15585.1 WcbO [Caballeronia novacaledonica]